MNPETSNFKEFFRNIQILHLAMFGGMAMIMLILKFILGIDEKTDDDWMFTIIGLTISVMSIGFGYFLYNKKISDLQLKTHSVPERLAAFREAFIFKLATLEGSALICLILHFLDGSPYLFYAFLFILLLFGFERPTELRIQDELKLRAQDLK